jgi:hypothetical protein
MAKVILICLLLSGCATWGTKIEYVEVPPKAPPVIERPVLETDYIKPGDDAGKVIQAHRLAIIQLQKWGMELEAALNAYRPKEKK